MTSDLITHLSKLDAPDREVDAAVFRYLAGNPTDHWFSFGEDHYTNETVPHVTASVDAAIALAERVLPGWRVENLCEWEDETLRSRGPWTCDLRKNGENFFSPLKGKCGHAPTPAIALLIALLRAKEASRG